MLQPGQVISRPPKKRSQAHPGVHPLSPLTHRTQRFQPLPSPLGEPPYHYDLESAIPGIAKAASRDSHIVFHTVGDTGGVKNADYQASVAAAMKEDLDLGPGEVPAFFYHLGDVVYFNGQISDYYGQFYEPYNHYTPPVISIPGNHDGDPIDTSQVPLDGWARYFMTPTPHVNPESQDAPRATMSLPNVYFALECPFVTIIGMYTNVPEHGSIDSIQQLWLTNEFATVPQDKAFILALHHPIYSFDDHHSGSPSMADAVQHAINDSRRVPNMILTAHVHNYQRIERNLAKGKSIPFLVVGHGGYYHLHNLTAAPGDTDPTTDAKLIAANDKQHGYATITVDKKSISGTMSTVDTPKAVGKKAADTFSYPVAATELPDGVVVSL
jgi:acid phosphatase type 7